MGRRFRSGQRLQLSANELNWLFDNVEYVAQQRKAVGVSTSRPSGAVTIHNGSGSFVRQFGVLTVGSPLWSVTDDTGRALTRQYVHFSGDTPDMPADWGNFAVVQDDLVASTAGRCIVAGISRVRLNIVHASHTHCDLIDGDVTQLDCIYRSI